MPLVESQPDAVARLYASSMFELAEAKGGQRLLEEISSQLADLVELARQDRRFSEFLSSRILARKDRESSLRSILDGRVHPYVLNLLLVLNAKERLGHLAVVVAAFDQLLQERFGRVEVDVFTAAPIDQGTLDKIGEAVRRSIGREPVMHSYIDKGMIGGLKLLVGDQLIDASLSTRLQRVRDRLKGPGADRLRQRISSLFDDTAS